MSNFIKIKDGESEVYINKLSVTAIYRKNRNDSFYIALRNGCSYRTDMNIDDLLLELDGEEPIAEVSRKPMTMLEYFRKCFPNCELDKTGIPKVCLQFILGNNIIPCDSALDCFECWSRPLPEGFKLPKFDEEGEQND